MVIIKRYFIIVFLILFLFLLPSCNNKVEDIGLHNQPKTVIQSPTNSENIFVNTNVKIAINKSEKEQLNSLLVPIKSSVNEIDNQISDLMSSAKYSNDSSLLDVAFRLRRLYSKNIIPTLNSLTKDTSNLDNTLTSNLAITNAEIHQLETLLEELRIRADNKPTQFILYNKLAFSSKELNKQLNNYKLTLINALLSENPAESLDINKFEPNTWKSIQSKYETDLASRFGGDFDNDKIKDYEDEDLDNDGVPNLSDNDDDNDGIKDVVEYNNLNLILSGVYVYLDNSADSISKEYYDLLFKNAEMNKYIIINMPYNQNYLYDNPKFLYDLILYSQQGQSNLIAYEKYVSLNPEYVQYSAFYSIINPQFTIDHPNVVVMPEFREFFEATLPPQLKSYFESNKDINDNYWKAKKNYEKTREELDATKLKTYFDNQYLKYSGYEKYSEGYSKVGGDFNKYLLGRGYSSDSGYASSSGGGSASGGGGGSSGGGGGGGGMGAGG